MRKILPYWEYFHMMSSLSLGDVVIVIHDQLSPEIVYFLPKDDMESLQDDHLILGSLERRTNNSWKAAYIRR